MAECIDLSEDSEKTVIVELNKTQDKTKTNINIITKHDNERKIPKDSKSVKNIYNLDDFSDGEFTQEFNYEPPEYRIKSSNNNSEPEKSSKTSWTNTFSADDFCEDSNDIDTILNRISQLESEQFSEKPDLNISKELQTLISGNIIEEPKLASEHQTQNAFRWSGSSDDSNEANGVEFHLTEKECRFKLADSLEDHSSGESLEPSGEPQPKRANNRKPATDKEALKLQKEMAKIEKSKEREQKKLEKEKQKQIKNALKVVQNCVKPDQCTQYITVNIDESISNKSYGDVIKAGLSNAGYKFEVIQQLVPNLISWTRKVPTLDNMLLHNVLQKEMHYLLVMEVSEFIQHIISDDLVTHIGSLLRVSQIDHLSVVILGLQRYYKHLKDERSTEYKATVSETQGNNKNTTKEFSNLPKIPKKQIDLKLVELQIFCKNIYIRPVEKFEDLAVFVGECTKAVTQIPYKKLKSESFQQENECYVVNNKDCVRIDKDGNGLGRLWNQFIRIFPLASLETAEAITSVYPTIKSLMEAYQNCESQEDAEKLLQDISVRRAAGPLDGQRRLGPEFSKKAFIFFCSEENVLL